MSSTVAQWATVLLWLGLAPFLFCSGTTGEFHAGAVVDVDITLVSSDVHGLACSLDDAPWGYACKYRSGGSVEQPSGALIPCLTVDRRDLLVPNLFAVPAIADRVAADEVVGLPREARERFIASCRVRVLARVRGVRRRVAAGGEFEPPMSSWLVSPMACTVRPDRR